MAPAECIEQLYGAVHRRVCGEPGRSQAIEQYMRLVLARLGDAETRPHAFDVSYRDASGLLVIDYRFREADRDGLDGDQLYRIGLRAIGAVYRADAVGALKLVMFNGWARFIDAATGERRRACLMSIEEERSEFLGADLDRDGPDVIGPDRADARFVAGRDVAGRLTQGTNLAAIGWVDFEHLIRELFAHEFSPSGGEVRVTRASRDGGVDAIAFDPDPIRGGKIVIQAKRYTNTVDVGAVRDLYGTVLNEGATKGILVTTSSFGPDAYAFAKDKPLTLLNGGNLLSILERHGHHAYIDLAEAKRIKLEPLRPAMPGD